VFEKGENESGVMQRENLRQFSQATFYVASRRKLPSSGSGLAARGEFAQKNRARFFYFPIRQIQRFVWRSFWKSLSEKRSRSVPHVMIFKVKSSYVRIIVNKQM